MNVSHTVKVLSTPGLQDSTLSIFLCLEKGGGREEQRDRERENPEQASC